MNRLQIALKEANLQYFMHIAQQDPQLLNYTDEKGRNIVFKSATDLHDSIAVQFFQFFAHNGMNFAHQDVNGRTVAFQLCKRGMVQSLTILSNVLPSALYHRDRFGQSPLFGAVKNYQKTFIRRMNIPYDLLNLVDQIAGHSLLFYAAACGYDDMAMILLKKGSEPLLKDKCGQDLLSYTAKTPRLEKEVRRKMMQLAQTPLSSKQSGMQIEQPNEFQREQAYQIKILRNNQLYPITVQQKQYLISAYRGLQQKQKEQAYFQHPDLDQSDNYCQNWRNLGMKIVYSCLRTKAGKWFEHTTDAAYMLHPQEFKGTNVTQLMGLRMVMQKLEHFIYKSPNQFQNDMQKIWTFCEKRGRGQKMEKDRINLQEKPRGRIYEYARELREHYYKLLQTYKYRYFY